jgi:hypothetical protein
VGEKKRSLLPVFWKTGGKRYEHRALAVYEDPSLILVLRRPSNLEEIYQLLGLPDIADIESPENALDNYWVLESAAEPAATKLRLSPLTTITSMAADNADDRERSCFEILTPAESIVLSAVHVRTDVKSKQEQSFKDSGAYLETLAAEASIAKTICGAHIEAQNIGTSEADITWKHQIVIGSLQSLVVSGNQKFLQDAVNYARTATANEDPRYLPARVIDAVDDNGFSALYYACQNKMDAAVRTLVNAGADVTARNEIDSLIRKLRINTRRKCSGQAM